MWIAPAAMFIESAADGLSKADPKMLAAEVTEMTSFGSLRMVSAFGAVEPLLQGVADQCDPNQSLAIFMAAGYLLGLQVARTILAGNPQLAMKGIKPDSLL
jgi:hypothetical protein